MRLALVTEGMIHRPIDALMDWLEEQVPEVRDLEVGTGGYSLITGSAAVLARHAGARATGVAAAVR